MATPEHNVISDWNWALVGEVEDTVKAVWPETIDSFVKYINENKKKEVFHSRGIKN